MSIRLAVLTGRRQRKLRHDLRVLVTFIRIYCDDHHADGPRAPVPRPIWRLTGSERTPIALCADCTRLLGHACAKRRACPLDPKPACKHCPEHCFLPSYREQIRRVMRHSGRRLVLSGRLDYLWHLLW
ncbi:MAG: nitrous oxide-stimulated promoter family protein [Phycisphaerales bacterium]|nr:nitrous oxide-stimulated promoter family protein [Phycisphaerales bacterium]